MGSDVLHRALGRRSGAGAAACNVRRVSTPLCIVVGPPSHGVTAYASDVADSLIEADPAVRRRDVATADLAEALVADERPARIHLHVTDKLFGSSLEDAADRVERLAALTSLTVTLHDLPSRRTARPPCTGAPPRTAAWRGPPTASS